MNKKLSTPCGYGDGAPNFYKNSEKAIQFSCICFVIESIIGRHLSEGQG